MLCFGERWFVLAENNEIRCLNQNRCDEHFYGAEKKIKSHESTPFKLGADC